MSFPSPEWIRHYFEFLTEADTGVGSVVAQYLCEEAEVPGSAHFQVFVEGRLVRWEPGVHPEHRFAIVQGPTDMEAMLTGYPGGNALLERTWIQEYRHGTPVRFRPPPLDERDPPGLAQLPVIPNATVTVQVHMHESPFGDLSCATRFVDGRLVEWLLGEHDEPDVVVEGPYEVFTRHRAREITMSEGIEDGRVTGDLSAIMLAVGLGDGPEYRRVVETQCCREAAVPLGLLGEIVTSPVYREALGQANAVRSSAVVKP